MLNAPIVMDGGAETDVSLQKKKEPYLLSAWADLAMAGGASLVLFSLCMLFVDKGAGAVSDGKILSSPILAQVSAAAFYLSFVCNFPHFILSYQLLYWDFGKRILTDRRYFGAVVLIPAILVITMVAVVLTRPSMISEFVRFMFLLVGWHYVKQVYGVFLLSSARKKVYYSATEKALLRVSLLSLAAVTWLASNSTEMPIFFYGFRHDTFVVPGWCMAGTVAVFVLTLAAFLVCLVQKYVRDGSLPPLSGAAALLSMIVWYTPMLYHPVFYYMVPFFHSLQYLWIGVTFRHKKISAATNVFSGRDKRLAYLRSFAGYIALTAIFGSLAFHFVPLGLDELFPYGHGPFRPQLIAALSAVFLNVHHYFIDSVIWRKDNLEVAQHLMKE